MSRWRWLFSPFLSVNNLFLLSPLPRHLLVHSTTSHHPPTTDNRPSPTSHRQRFSATSFQIFPSIRCLLSSAESSAPEISATKCFRYKTFLTIRLSLFFAQDFPQFSSLFHQNGMSATVCVCSVCVCEWACALYFYSSRHASCVSPFAGKMFGKTFPVLAA